MYKLDICTLILDYLKLNYYYIIIYNKLINCNVNYI